MSFFGLSKKIDSKKPVKQKRTLGIFLCLIL